MVNLLKKLTREYMNPLSSYNNNIISVGCFVEQTTSNVIDNIHYLHEDIEENFVINYPLDLLLLKMQKSRIIDNNANTSDICKKEFLILNEAIKKNIFSFFTTPLEFEEKNFNLSIKDILNHLQEFCKNKNIKIKSLAIVGSTVPFLLGTKYLKEAFKKLDPTLELSEDFFKFFSKKPSDHDIRIYFNDDNDNPISDEQLDSFNHAIRNLIVGCITKKDPNVQIEEISKETKKYLSKTTFFYGNDGIYTISRINPLNMPPIELLGIKHLSREFLFDQDALSLVINDNNGQFEITLKCCIQNYWQPIIDRSLKLIRSSDNPHTINQEAWPIYLLLLAKGYRCVDKALHNILREKITKNGINEKEVIRLLQKKVLTDLNDSNGNAIFAIIFMGIEMLHDTSDAIQIKGKPTIVNPSVINCQQEKLIWNLLPFNFSKESDESRINLNSILKRIIDISHLYGTWASKKDFERKNNEITVHNLTFFFLHFLQLLNIQEIPQIIKLWRSNHNKSNSLIFEIIEKNEKRKNTFLHIPYDPQRLLNTSLTILTEIYNTQEECLISMTRNFLCDLALHSEFAKSVSIPYIFSKNLNSLLTHTNPLIKFMGCILVSKIEDHFLGSEERKRYLLALSYLGKSEYNNEKTLLIKAAASLLSTSKENSTNKLRKKQQNILKNIVKKQYEGINTDLIKLAFLSENTTIAYAAYACWEQLYSDGLAAECNSLGLVLLQTIDENNFDKCLMILASLIKNTALSTAHAEDYLKKTLSFFQKKTYASNDEKIARSFLAILESTSSDSYFLNHQLTEQIADWLITHLNQYKGDSCIHFIIRGLKKGYWESFGNILETTIVEQLTKSNPSLSTLFLWNLIKVSTFYTSNIKSDSKWATILLKFTENFVEKHEKVWNLFPSFYDVISEISIENLITWREKQQYAQLLEKCSKNLPEDILKQAHKLFKSHHTKIETLNNSELLIRIIYYHIEKNALNDAIELVNIITEKDYQSHNLQYDTLFKQISEYFFNFSSFNNSLDAAALVNQLITFSNNPIVDQWKKNDSSYITNSFSFIKQVVNVLNLNEFNIINFPIVQILLDCIVLTNANPQCISSKIKTALGSLLVKILEYSWQKSNKLSNGLSNLLNKKIHEVTTLLIGKKQYFTYCKFIWLLSFNNISFSHNEKKQLSFAINKLSIKITESKKNNLNLVQNLIKTIFSDSSLVIPSIKSLIDFYLKINKIDNVLYWVSKINNTHISKTDPLQISPEDILEWGKKISSDEKNIEKSIHIYLQFKDFLTPFYMHFLNEWKHISSFELTDRSIALLEGYLSFLKKLLKNKKITAESLKLFSKEFAITTKHVIYSENNNSLQLLLAILDNMHVDELRSLFHQILASSKKISTSNHMQKIWYLFQKLPESSPKNLYNQQMLKESSDLWLQLLILINKNCSPPFFNILNKLPFEFTFPKDIDSNITLQFINILIKILEYNTKNHLAAIDVQGYIYKLFYHHQLPTNDSQVVKLKTAYCLHALRNTSLEKSTELLLESSSYLLCSDNGDIVNVLTIFYKKINDFLKKSNIGISEEDGKKIILLSEIIINNKWIEPFPIDLIRLLITIEVKQNIENVIHLILIGIVKGIRTHIIVDLINLIPILCIELKNEKLQKSIESILTYLENSAKNANEKIYHHFLITYFTSYYNCYLENQNKRLEAVGKFIENSQIYLNRDIEKTFVFQILSKIIVKENFEEKLLESIRNSFKGYILSQTIQEEKQLDYEHFLEILLVKILNISSIKQEGAKFKKTIMVANELLIHVMSCRSIAMLTKMDLLEKFFFWQIAIYGSYYNLHQEYCVSIFKIVKDNKSFEISSELYAKLAIKMKDFDFLTNCNENLNEIFLYVIESYLKSGSLIGITEAINVISFGKKLIKDNGKTFSLITNKILNTISENANKLSLHKFPHHLFQNISKLLLSEKINCTIFSKPIKYEENFLEFEKSNYYRSTWLSFAEHYINFFKNRFKEFQTSLNYNPGKEFLEVMLKAKQNRVFEGYNNYSDAFSKIHQAFPLLESCCISSIISNLLTNLLLDFVNLEDFSITITQSMKIEGKKLILSWFNILVKISPKLLLKILTKNNKALKIFPDEEERKKLINSYELQKKFIPDSKITQVKLHVLISKRKTEKIYWLSQHLLNNNLSVFEEKISNEIIKKIVLLLLKQAKRNTMNSNNYCECAFNLTKNFLHEELNHLLVKLCKSISIYCDRKIKLKCIQFLIQLSFENKFEKIKKENYEASWRHILKLEEEKTFDQVIELWNIKFKDIKKSKIIDDLKKQLEFKYLLSQMPELKSSKTRGLFLKKIINDYNNYNYKFECYYLLAIKLDDVELQSMALKKYISFFFKTPSFINDKQKINLLISQLQTLRRKFDLVSFNKLVDSMLFIVNYSETINEALFLEIIQWKSVKAQEIVLNQTFEFLKQLDKDEESDQTKIDKLSKTAKTVLKNILTIQVGINKKDAINMLVNCLQVISLDYDFFKDITNYIPHELIGNAFKCALQISMSQPYTNQTINNVIIVFDKLHMIFHLNKDVTFIVLDEYVKLLTDFIENSTDKNFHDNYNKFTKLENLFFNVLKNSLINDYEIDEDDIINDQKIFEEFTNNSWTPKQHLNYSLFFIHSKISIFQNMIKAIGKAYDKEKIIDFISSQMNYFSKNFTENEKIQSLLISLIDKPALYFLEKNIYLKFLSSYIGAINTVLSNVKMNIPAERCLTLALISSSLTSNNSLFKKQVPEKFHNHNSIPIIIKHIIDIYLNIPHIQPQALAFNLFINHQKNELTNAYEKKQECLASLANNVQKYGLEPVLNNINAVIHYHAIIQHELDHKKGSKNDFYKKILKKSLEIYTTLIQNNSEKTSSINSLLKMIFCTLKDIIKDPYYSDISSTIGNFLIQIKPAITSSNNINEAKELFFIQTKSKATANSLKKSYLIWQKTLPKS